jgi:hypothetical protein
LFLLALRATLADISLTFRHIGCDSPVECSYYLSVIAVHARSEPKAPLTLSTDPWDVTITYPEPEWPWTATTVVVGPTTTLYARHGSASTSIPKPEVKRIDRPTCYDDRSGLATCNFLEEECTDCVAYPDFCVVSVVVIIHGTSPGTDHSLQRCNWSSQQSLETKQECRTYTEDGIVVMCKESKKNPYDFHFLPGVNGTEHSHGPVVVPHHSNGKKDSNDKVN